MNKSIVRLANVMLAGFVVIAAGLFYWQIVRAGGLTADPAINRTRQLDEENRVQRGRILDRNGVVLAQSERDGNGWQRKYAIPSLVHVVGYHSSRLGNAAVEDRFDDYLRGAKGLDSATALQNRLMHKASVADDVVLTIDTRLQQVADAALGNDTGAVVALNPRSGEVLAMASHPYFDPNEMEQRWDSIRQNADKPLLNRATQGLYTPGSTFKTVTLAAALEARVTQPGEVFRYEMKQDERGGYYHDTFIQGFRIYDANHGVTEDQLANLDLAHAYAVSCNVAFAELGLRLGPRQLSEAANRFGFGSAVPIDLSAATSRLGPEGIAKGDPAVASTAFGQGQLQVTPLQMALVAAAVANGGVIPRPFVTSSVRGMSGAVWTATPGEWRRAMDGSTASIVEEMMLVSAQEGWAQTAQIPGVKVAAKTGTAEVGPGQQSHAWLIAFAPADDPVVAVAVIKEHAGGGATQAGPAAKAVMAKAIELAAAR